MDDTLHVYCPRKLTSLKIVLCADIKNLYVKVLWLAWNTNVYNRLWQMKDIKWFVLMNLKQSISLFFYTKACKSNWRVECLLMELRKNVHFRNSPIRPLHLLFRKPPSHILQLNGDAVFHFSKSRVHNQLTKYLRTGLFFYMAGKKTKNMTHKMLPFPHSNR